jgi:hypothetical protein
MTRAAQFGDAAALDARALELSRDLYALDREEDGIRRLLAAQRRYADTVDWAALSPDQCRRVADHRTRLKFQLDQVGAAIDRRLFELIDLAAP